MHLFDSMDPYHRKLKRLSQAMTSMVPMLVERYGCGTRVAEMMTVDPIGGELPFLLTQIGLWLLRGVSVEDIERYAANPTDQLPFEGAERVMYGALLDALAERAGDREKAVHMVVSLANLFNELLELVHQKSELDRADIHYLIYRPDGPAIHEQRDSAA